VPSRDFGRQKDDGARLIVAAFTEQTRGLREARAEAEALVISHEGHIGKLEADLAAARRERDAYQMAAGHMSDRAEAAEERVRIAEAGEAIANESHRRAEERARVLQRERDNAKADLVQAHDSVANHSLARGSAERRAALAESEAAALRKDLDAFSDYYTDLDAARAEAAALSERVERYEAAIRHANQWTCCPALNPECPTALREKVGRLEAAAQYAIENGELGHWSHTAINPEVRCPRCVFDAALAPAPAKSE
jgi:chromosome segregation ATPase